MRKIEQHLINTIIHNAGVADTPELYKRFKSGNTELIMGRELHKQAVLLHGNYIGIIDYKARTVSISLASWVSRTTISRVNALLQGLTQDKRRVITRDFEPYLSSDAKPSPAERMYHDGFTAIPLCESLYI